MAGVHLFDGTLMIPESNWKNEEYTRGANRLCHGDSLLMYYRQTRMLLYPVFLSTDEPSVAFSEVEL